MGGDFPGWAGVLVDPLVGEVVLNDLERSNNEGFTRLETGEVGEESLLKCGHAFGETSNRYS